MSGRFIVVSESDRFKPCVIYVPEWESTWSMYLKWKRDGGVIECDASIPSPIGKPRYSSGSEMFQRFLMEAVSRQRSSWCPEAKALCQVYESEISELFKTASTIEETRGLAGELRAIRLRLDEAKMRVQRAEESAEEWRRRAASADPDRIRREMEAEFKARSSWLLEENRRVVAELHEAKSQLAKLAEDKKRLRAALNGARSRA